MEGDSNINRANRACDPIYWFGEFVNENVLSSFSVNGVSIHYMQNITKELGGACFFVSARLFKIANPNWSNQETQLFNFHKKL